MSLLVCCEGLANGFSANFLNYLINVCSRQSSSKICVLYKPLPEEKIPSSLIKSLGNEILLFYGSPSNMNLVAKIVTDYKVEVVYEYIDSRAEESSGSTDSIVHTARKHLLTLTSLLEALRKCRINHFVQIYTCASKTCGAFSDVINYNQEIYPAIRPATLSSARFSSALAVLHAYAKSYRLNVQVARLITDVNFESTAFKFVYELGFKVGNTKAVEISTFDSTGKAEPPQLDKTTTTVSTLFIRPTHPSLEAPKSTNVFAAISYVSKGLLAARILVYGAKNWIGQQFIQLVKTQQVDYVTAVCRPGTDLAHSIRQEIVKHSPSHVVLILHQSSSSSEGQAFDYAGAGSTNLLHNVQDNLYSPWNLANICEKIGVHFTYFGTSCLYSHSTALQLRMDENSMEHLKIDEWNGENRYSLTKKFTDLALNGFTKTLNAHFQLAFNEEKAPQNFLYQIFHNNKTSPLISPSQTYSATHLPTFLPILLKFMLSQEVGELNLVHPQPITFHEIMAIVNGKWAEQTEVETASKEETHNHGVLDTSRIAYLDITSTPEAIRQTWSAIKSTI